MTRRLSLMIDSLSDGGAERVLVAVAPRLHERDWDVTVDVLIDRVDPELAATLQRSGVDLRVHGVERLASPAAWRTVDRLLRDVDLLHAQLEFATIIGGALSLRSGVPTVTTHHVFSHGGRSRAALRTRLEHAVARRWAARTVAVSAAGRDHLVDDLGYRPEKVVVLHNGVDETRFRPTTERARTEARAQLGIDPGSPVLISAAFLREQKGLQYLLAAMPTLLGSWPDLVAVVVGDGPHRVPLEDEARRLGIDHAVRFLGARDDVAALLPVADLFVHPTLTDVLPTSVIEAMATGLAVVASRTGGLPELVDDGVTGRLVPPAAPSALAHVVGELLSRPGDRRRMGDAGRRRVELDLTLSAQVSGLDRLYRSVLDSSMNGVRR